MNDSKAMRFNKTLLAIVISIALVMVTLVGLTLLRSSDVAHAAPTDNWTDGNYETFSWYDGHESDTEYTLDTPKKFAGFAYLVNNGNNFSGKTIKLGANINLSGHKWTPIGYDGTDTNDIYFAGTFDGQWHTISNMTVNVTDYHQYSSDSFALGLFGYVSGATIKNVMLASSCSVASRNSLVGGIVGSAKNTMIDNVRNCATVRGDLEAVGGIVGYAKNTTIKDASNAGAVSGWCNVGGIIGGAENVNILIENSEFDANSGSVTGTFDNVGGIVGSASGGSIKNVINQGRVINQCTLTEYRYYNVGRNGVGGIVGQVDYGTSIEHVINNGEVKGKFDNENNDEATERVNGVGGIAGCVHDGVSITDANNSGTIENDIDGVGGIVGYVRTSVSITGVDNTGEIKGRNGVGGIVGTIDGSIYSNVSVENATNGNAVTGTGSNVGGIVGCIYSHCNLITGAVNTGTITGVDNVGGLVGLGNVNRDRVLLICNSYNRGSINSGILATGTYKGGLVGKNNCRMTIVNCYNAYCIMYHENKIDGSIVGNNSDKLILENVYYDNSGVIAIGINVENEGATYSGTAIGMSDTDMKGAIDVSSSLAYKLNEYAGVNNNIYEIDSTEYILRNWKVSSNDYPMLAITIVYKLNGGTGSLPEPNYTYDIDDEITLPSGITKLGNKFVGWNDGTSTYDAGAPYTIKSETVVFTAQWLPVYWTDSGNYKTDWYDGHESDTEYTLTTPEQFAGLAYLVNNGNNFSGKTIKLGNDMDLLGTVHNASGVFWTPIGTDSIKFNGTFDGQGHTISHMIIDTDVQYAGLFGCVSGATIRNVILDSSCSVTSTANNVGGLIGYAYEGTLIEEVINHGNVSGNKCVGGISGHIEKSKITNAINTGTIKSNSGEIGGIVGAASGSTIEDVRNEGTVDERYDMGSGTVGGIAGSVNSDYDGYVISIKNAVNSGTISGRCTFYGGVGGIVGKVSIGVLIENASNEGNVTGELNDVIMSGVGGIIGYIGDIIEDADAKLLNCNNKATITGTKRYNDASGVGGLVGAMYASMSISNSYNTGNINAEVNSGGIVGYFRSNNYEITILNCYNTGAITGGSNNGGIIGNNSDTANIANSYNAGVITGESNNGGIIGANSHRANILNCYNTGTITGGSNNGGIVGSNSENSDNYYPLTIVNSYNAGVITGESNNGGIVGNNSGTATVESVYYLEGISEVGNSNEGSTYTGTATPMSDENMKGALNDNNSLVYKLNRYVDEHPTYTVDTTTVDTTEYALKLWNVTSNEYPTLSGYPLIEIAVTYNGGDIAKGNKIQGDDIVITATYSDDSTATVSATDESVTYSINNGTPIADITTHRFMYEVGTVAVTVSYNGQNATIDINVVAPIVTGMEVTYNGGYIIEGEKIQGDKIVITATYSDDSTQNISTDNESVTYSIDENPIDITTHRFMYEVDMVIVMVEYGGQEAEMQLTVIPPLVNLTARYTGGEIAKGEKIQGDKLQVTVTCEDGSTLPIVADDENISYWVGGKEIKDPINHVFDEAGQVKVTVKYKGQEAVMTLTVADDDTATPTATAETSDSGLSVVAIAGIVIGALILLGVIILLIYFDQVTKKQK